MTRNHQLKEDLGTKEERLMVCNGQRAALLDTNSLIEMVKVLFWASLHPDILEKNER